MLSGNEGSRYHYCKLQLVFLFRAVQITPAISQIRAIDVAWSVCMCVCRESDPCKNGRTDRDVVWAADSPGPKTVVATR